MPIRSIKLKLLLDRTAEGRRLRRDLWTTHATINGAVAELEALLLLWRGCSYTAEAGVVPGEEVRASALARARRTQAGNGFAGRGTDGEVLAALRQFYEAVVPSARGEAEGKPSAQDAAAFAGPMMDPRSEGMQKVFEKMVDPLPGWAGRVHEDDEAWQKESEAWLETDQAQALLHATGSPPAWVRRLRAGKAWQESFVECQQRYGREAEGVPRLVKHLKQELGLLPALPPPVARQIPGTTGVLTPWDRLALRLAVGHLLSWESWNRRAAEEHRRVLAQVERGTREVARFGRLVDDLRRYECQRHEELKRVALANDERPFRITRRMVRGWDKVRERWLGMDGGGEAGRWGVLGELQTRMRARFGDPDLFRWLARDGNEGLWRDADPLPHLARLNALERLLGRKKECALYTPPDARLHPRWTQHEPPGGGNLRNYGVRESGGGLVVSLPLLGRDDEHLVEVVHELRVAPSKQFQNPRVTAGRGKAPVVDYRSSYQDFRGKLGSSDVLFGRRHLANRSAAALAEGDVGSVWLKLSLDLDARAPEGWLDGRGRATWPEEFKHFRTALVTRSKPAGALQPGLRVLAVDLGVRNFAACSVFELVKGRPKKGLSFQADADGDLWASHEASFLLRMPGETVDAGAQQARREAYDDLRELRRRIAVLRMLLRLSVREGRDERAALIEDLIQTATADGEGELLAVPEMEELASLQQQGLELPPQPWRQKVLDLHRQAERRVGERIAAWRRQTRPRAADKADLLSRRGYDAGKSAWAVDYLTGIRRLLQSWSLHGRSYAEIRRMDREKRGVFAANLLQHINSLKEDRVKAGADLIVQAARGFAPLPKRGWVKEHEPCRVILLEDLARYRFRTDRPRRENSLLMRWSHRRILSEVQLQAELYGIVVDTAGAGFTSRFHARTGAPGVRARRVTGEDVGRPGFMDTVRENAGRLGIELAAIDVGMVVPWPGGELLATLDADGRPRLIHADLNAAQNLQRRFWTRHADAFRLRAVEVAAEDGPSLWYLAGEGKRLRGALSRLVGGDGYARLTRASGEGDCVLEPVSREGWRRAVGEGPVDEEGSEADELSAELAELSLPETERAGGGETFFRDPSGLVLPSDRWYPGRTFWHRVETRIFSALAGTADAGGIPF